MNWKIEITNIWHDAEEYAIQILGTDNRDRIKASYTEARQKVENIINLYGVDDGERLKPEYIGQIIVETVKNTRLHELFCSIDYIRAEMDKKGERPASLTCRPLKELFRSLLYHEFPKMK